MKLIGRVTLMAFCILAAYALPSLTDVNVEEENVMLRALVEQYQRATVVKPVPAVNNSQNACTDKFSEVVTKINNQTVNKTQGCYASADAKLQEFDETVLNKTVASVNALSKNLTMTFSNCSAKASNIDILVCFIETFDKTMANLNRLTSQSQLAISSVNNVENSIEFDTKVCVSEVLTTSKVNSSIAANDLQACLSNSTVGRIYELKAGIKTKVLYLN